MRVAFEATPLLETTTGVGTFINEVLRRLPRHGVDVVSFAYTRVYLDEFRAAVPDGVSVPARAIPARTTRRLWKRADWPAIEYWTGPIDVVHGPNFVIPPTKRAAALVTVHDLTPVHHPEYCDANTVQYPRLIRRALRRGAHVHAVSQFVADEVADVFGLARDRIHVVYNGVSDVRAGDSDTGRRIAGSDRYVLAIGTIEPRKNLAALVRAFDVVAASDTDVRLVIAGARGWKLEEFDAALAEARASKRIVLTGRVDDATRADLLAGATLLAYPSRYEGFGLPPLEAMSVGVPVLATAVGALPEVLGDAALLVAPTDSGIADGLTELLGSAAQREKMIGAGRDRVRRYSWDRCATELIDVYEKLSAGRAR
jgi:glycosyltransferase involved in cell wall biosynthesis